jgi:hypothetical protein
MKTPISESRIDCHWCWKPLLSIIYGMQVFWRPDLWTHKYWRNLLTVSKMQYDISYTFLELWEILSIGCLQWWLQCHHTSIIWLFINSPVYRSFHSIQPLASSKVVSTWLVQICRQKITVAVDLNVALVRDSVAFDIVHADISVLNDGTGAVLFACM